MTCFSCLHNTQIFFEEEILTIQYENLLPFELHHCLLLSRYEVHTRQNQGECQSFPSAASVIAQDFLQIIAHLIPKHQFQITGNNMDLT
mgnify:CR=1 FL=1